MTHHHHIPSAPLDQHIAGFTYYKGYRPVHSIDRYLPNGNIEIIIDLTGTPKHSYFSFSATPPLSPSASLQKARWLKPW